jgi:protein-S-isoprenylcysteine O-methyltransferase Ste14
VTVCPALGLGWLNGWILLMIEFLIQGSLLAFFPKEVVGRLFDRSGWSNKQRGFLFAGKVFSLLCLVLIILTPLNTGSSVFIVGLMIYIIGIFGLVISMLNFKNTSPDQPVTRGLYKISRHPQIVSLFIIFLGICLAIGSWFALFALIISRVLQHFSILAEEEVCLQQYGAPYQHYLQDVPRYFLFF